MTYADQSKREITITTSETFTVARVNREIAGVAWHVGDHTMYVTDGTGPGDKFDNEQEAMERLLNIVWRPTTT
jgi:hypothetical protein